MTIGGMFRLYNVHSEYILHVILSYCMYIVLHPTYLSTHMYVHNTYMYICYTYMYPCRATQSNLYEHPDTHTAGGAADGAVVCATDGAVAVAAVRPADGVADGAVVRAALHTASSPCGQSMAQ